MSIRLHWLPNTCIYIHVHCTLYECKQHNFTITLLVNQMPRSVNLPQGQLIMILVIEHVH